MVSESRRSRGGRDWPGRVNVWFVIDTEVEVAVEDEERNAGSWTGGLVGG